MECEKCPLTPRQRQKVHCGWLPESKWLEPGFRARVGFPKVDVCPGYTTQLPQVLEAACALSWREAGSLTEYYDSPLTDLLRSALDVIGSQVRMVERFHLKQASS